MTKEFIIKLVSINGLFLMEASDNGWHQVKEVAVAALKENGAAFKCLPKNLMKDSELALLAIENGFNCFEFYMLNLDYQIALDSIKHHGINSKIASNMHTERDNVKFALELVSIKGRYLEFCQPHHRATLEIVERAIENDGIALKYVLCPQSKELILKAVSNNWKAFEFADKGEGKSNKTVVIAAIKNAISKAGNHEKRVATILRTMVRQLLYNQEFMLEVVALYPPAFTKFKRFHDDITVILRVLRTVPESIESVLKSVSEDLRTNKDFITQVIPINESFVKHFPEFIAELAQFIVL